MGMTDGGESGGPDITTGAMERERLRTQSPGFSRGLSVGFHDRGMGRGDYAVIRVMGGETLLIAKLVDIGIEGRSITIDDVNPVMGNAFLFAAAPDLYDECQAALAQFKVIKELAGDRADATVTDLIARLEVTLAMALPPAQRHGRFAAPAQSDGTAPEGDETEPAEDDGGDQHNVPYYDIGGEG